jgi:hypothetical protein
MVQPKTPPISIRLSPTMLAEVDAYAERSKITRHAAINSLLALGIADAMGAVADARAKPIGSLVVIRKPPAPYGSRLKKR